MLIKTIDHNVYKTKYQNRTNKYTMQSSNGSNGNNDNDKSKAINSVRVSNEAN